MIYIKMRGESGGEVVRVESRAGVNGKAAARYLVAAAVGSGLGVGVGVGVVRVIESQKYGSFEETGGVSTAADRIMDEFPRIKFDFRESVIEEGKMERILLVLESFEGARGWLKESYGIECESLVEGEPILVKTFALTVIDNMPGIKEPALGYETRLFLRHRVGVVAESEVEEDVVIHEISHAICQSKEWWQQGTGKYVGSNIRGDDVVIWYEAKNGEEGGVFDLMLDVNEEMVVVRRLSEYKNVGITWLVWSVVNGKAGTPIPDSPAADAVSGVFFPDAETNGYVGEMSQLAEKLTGVMQRYDKGKYIFWGRLMERIVRARNMDELIDGITSGSFVADTQTREVMEEEVRRELLRFLLEVDPAAKEVLEEPRGGG